MPDANPTVWDIGTAIATMMGVFLALVGAWFAYRQLRGLRSQGDLEGAKAIMEELRRPDTVDTIRELYATVPDATRFHPRIQEFERVLDRLEWLGIMLGSGVINKKLCMTLAGAMAPRVWYVMEGYISLRGGQRGRYARNVRYLTKRSIQYQIKSEPRGEWPKLRIPDSRTEIDLVPVLLERGILTPWQFSSAKRWRRIKRNWRAELALSRPQMEQINQAFVLGREQPGKAAPEQQ